MLFGAKMYVHVKNVSWEEQLKTILNLNDAFCHKIYGSDKMFEIFNFFNFQISKFSNIRQMDRGDPRVAG